MQRKILDVWPKLMRPLRSQSSRIEETDQEQEREDNSSEDEAQNKNEFDEQELLEFYKNLYWTRLIKVENSVFELNN